MRQTVHDHASPKLPKRFLGVALLTGFSSSNAVVGLPLLVNSSSSPSSHMGLLLALVPLGTALGAFVAAPVRNGLGSAAATMLVAFTVIITGGGALIFSSATFSLSIGMILIGLGVGIYWVCTHVLLSSSPQSHGLKSAYASQYALYTAGVLAGALITGILVSGLEALGVAPVLAGHLSLVLGVAASTVSFLAWWPKRQSIADEAGKSLVSCKIITTGLRLQIQDLYIVAALAFVSLLAPLILLDTFSFSPFLVGATMGSIALCKIWGLFSSAFPLVYSAVGRQYWPHCSSVSLSAQFWLFQ